MAGIAGMSWQRVVLTVGVALLAVFLANNVQFIGNLVKPRQ